MKRFAFVLAAMAAILATQTAALGGSITVKGSDTMVVLAQKWAEAYMAKNPNTKIQVTGGGSGTGVAALQNKTTDICNSSRKLKAPEIANCVTTFGRRPTEHKAALDGLSIYVHDSNPLKEISMEQIQQIFTGKIRNWKEIGGPDARIAVYSRENNSGTYEFFKEHVLQGKDFAASAQTMPGTAAVLQSVAKDKNAIGYGGVAYGQGAKSLLVKKTDTSPAIEPSEENVLNGKYPIWRYLYIYLNPAVDKGEVGDYIRWIRSDDGQKLVKDVGYFPLPKNLRD